MNPNDHQQDQWPDDPLLDSVNSQGTPPDDLRDTIDGIGQDTDEILDILRDGQQQPMPRPPQPQQRRKRSVNSVIDQIVDQVSSQVTQDIAAAQPDTPPVADQGMPRAQRQRDARGRWISNTPPVADPDQQTTTPTAGAANADSSPVGQPDTPPVADTEPNSQGRRRDANGRWLPSDQPTTDITTRNQPSSAGGDSDADQVGRKGESPAYWDKFSHAVGQGMQDATQGVDPTVEALREAGVFKAVSWVFGKKDKLPKEQSKHNRIVERLLRRMAKEGNREGGGGSSWMILLRLAPLLITAVVAGLAAMAATVGAAIAAAVGNAIGGLINGLLSQTETGRQVLDVTGELSARAAAALGNDEAQATVDANDAADDAKRYRKRERNPSWLGKDRWYELARSVGLGRFFSEDEESSEASTKGHANGSVDFSGVDLSSKDKRPPKNVNTYDQIMIDEYAKQGFNPEQMAILKSQVHAESGFDPLAKSPAGAFGLTQFVPATARQYKVQQGSTPVAVRSQIAGQAKYMRYLLNRYGGDWDKALAGYNAGEGNVDKAITRAKALGGTWRNYLPKPSETLPYLDRVHSRVKLYRSSPSGQANKPVGLDLPANPTLQTAATTRQAQLEGKALLDQFMPSNNMALPTTPQTKVITPAIPYRPQYQPSPKLPAQPKTSQQINTPQPQAPVTSMGDDSMTQNVGDRQLAHLITGGLGMGGQIT